MKNINTEPERIFLVTLSYRVLGEHDHAGEPLYERSKTYRVRASNDLDALKDATLEALGMNKREFNRKLNSVYTNYNYDFPTTIEDMLAPDIAEVLFDEGYGIGGVYDSLTRKYSEDLVMKTPSYYSDNYYTGPSFRMSQT